MSRALEFFRKTAAQNSEVQRSGATEADEKNNLICAPERLKSSPSSPSYPEPNGVLAPGGPDDAPQASRLARPPSEPAPAAAGNSGNSGNFLVGSDRKNRNFCETGAAAPRGSGHKDAIGALRRLKHEGASVTWDGHESRVSFDAPSGGDQASLECYRKAAVEVDAYLAAELPEFTPAEQVRAHRLARDLAVEVIAPSNPGHAGTLIAELIALSGDSGLCRVRWTRTSELLRLRGPLARAYLTSGDHQ